MSRQVPAILIAGTHSGVGKTTVTTGIVGALRRRGLAVQPFKVGPDYIDPTYTTRIAGRPCRNLDAWMVPADRLVELYTRAVADADVVVVEGVMGLFDGHPGRGAGSTAELAKLLGLPVVLVMDVGRMGQSAAAVALGYVKLDPAVDLVGVIVNEIGSPGHLRMVESAIGDATGLPVVGHLPRRPDLALPERHLGLIPVDEGRTEGEFFSRLVAQVEESVDVEALLRLAAGAPVVAGEPTGLFPEVRVAPRASIAVAQDEAFCFYYQDNLDLLAAWGARLVPFSPLRDGALPADCDGVYVGGGFPEFFAARLAENRALLAGLRAAHAAGMPIYAECGGLMYLCRTLGDLEGGSHEAVGLVPANAVIKGGRMALGYAEVKARRHTLLLGEGEVARGHEFHYSSLDASPGDVGAAYVFAGGDRREGYVEGNLLASYVHLHFGSNPGLAPGFVAACAGWGASR
ncbi:MAG: cobyrinate a,c-diamide synthase [Chloroflexota bacterium]